MIKCEYCGKEFDGRGIKTHQRFKHGNVPVLKCNICGKLFKGEAALRMHVLFKHSKSEDKIKDIKKKISAKTKENWKKGIYQKDDIEKARAVLREKRKDPKFKEEVCQKAQKGQKEHDNAIDEEMKNFLKDGFRCIPVGSRKYRTPDFIAFKDNKIFAIEVEFGKIKPEKYSNIQFYDDIIWIKRER